MLTERPRLIVVEGIDLSGRTTQVRLLQQWLLAQNYAVTTTALRTSPLISDILERARDAQPLQPLTYSMLYCADHLDRTQRVIQPALERGEIVLADRYIYTSFARDQARGLDAAWVRNLYRFSVEPDAVFYLHISPDEAVRRRIVIQQLQREHTISKHGKGKKGKKKQHEQQGVNVASPAIAGSATLAAQTVEGFRDFEKRVYNHYQDMQKEFHFSVIEGSQSIEFVQTMLRRAIMRLLLEE